MSDSKLPASLKKALHEICQDRQAPCQVHIHSKEQGLDLAVTTNEGDADRPYHIASIGKLFTLSLIGRLIDQGQVGMDTLVAELLDSETLQGLFVYKGVDYRGEVTIRQLLNHTSGVNDYFEGIGEAKSTFVSQIIKQPDRVWHPLELLHYTSTHQQAVGRPGAKFLYSDTGFVLLGLIIEKISGQSFGGCLQKHIFRPLALQDTYLLFHTEPANAVQPIMPILLQGHDVTKYRSLSCDWAGGGIISTTTDQVRFLNALVEGQLFSKELFNSCLTFENPFRAGLYYGAGIMQVRFEKLFFLLRGYPRLYGHIGVLATHLFRVPDSDISIAMNYGNDRHMVKSFHALIKLAGVIRQHSNK